MQLEDYFEFLAPDDIRIKGHRIGIESVLYEYVHRDQGPEAMAVRFPTLELELIYASILYYLHNRERMDAYLAAWLDYGRRMREQQDRTPPPVVVRLRDRETDKQTAAAAP
jgi:uncharacterized protein (DUF433 family)